jgi:hypothetical protein
MGPASKIINPLRDSAQAEMNSNPWSWASSRAAGHFSQQLKLPR